MIWQFIKADQFFPAYCPKILNYKRKISGRNSKGQPLDFTEAEKKAIKKALKQMTTDLTK